MLDEVVGLESKSLESLEVDVEEDESESLEVDVDDEDVLEVA